MCARPGRMIKIHKHDTNCLMFGTQALALEFVTVQPDCVKGRVLC